MGKTCRSKDFPIFFHLGHPTNNRMNIKQFIFCNHPSELFRIHYIKSFIELFLHVLCAGGFCHIFCNNKRYFQLQAYSIYKVKCRVFANFYAHILVSFTACFIANLFILFLPAYVDWHVF